MRLIYRQSVVINQQIIGFQKIIIQIIMEFTQIQEISSFSTTYIHSKNPRFTKFSTYHENQTLSSSEIIDQSQFNQLMTNLTKLNSQIPNQSTFDFIENEDSNLIQQKIIRQTKQADPQGGQSCECHKKYDRTKSIIFKNSFSSQRSLTDSKLNTMAIKVFYFGSPIMKLITYNKRSTIKQLIKRSLDTYLLQNNDTILATQTIEKFQMRLPSSQNDFCPDVNIEPIHLDRVLSENMFQTLVLVEKFKKETCLQSKPTKEYSFDSSNQSFSSSLKSQIGSGETIKFVLMDETYFQLIRIELDKEGTLEKLFRVIEENELNESKDFVIKDDPEGQFNLTPDHEVKLIEKNRLYLMTKKYLDEAEDELPGPIRLKTLIQQEINYVPPIGMTEASRYQEFQVTKVNSFGIAIDRILGIDQTKIYNYQKQLRQQKRQASFVDKILGFNNQTGTKIPFRFIKDIVEIKKFQGGIQVVYPQKVTIFVIKNESALQKISRKLQFLFELNKSKQKSLSELKTTKKTRSFFKF